jgi:hypothetical protein
MRRFEKIAEEEKRRKREQELKFSVEDKPEICVNSNSKNERPKRTQ